MEKITKADFKIKGTVKTIYRGYTRFTVITKGRKMKAIISPPNGGLKMLDDLSEKEAIKWFNEYIEKISKEGPFTDTIHA